MVPSGLKLCDGWGRGWKGKKLAVVVGWRGERVGGLVGVTHRMRAEVNWWQNRRR